MSEDLTKYASRNDESYFHAEIFWLGHRGTSGTFTFRVACPASAPWSEAVEQAKEQGYKHMETYKLDSATMSVYYHHADIPVFCGDFSTYNKEYS